MNSTVLIPRLFPMQSEFADFRQGKCIRVSHKDATHLGTLLVTHQVAEGLFGLTIQFARHWLRRISLELGWLVCDNRTRRFTDPPPDPGRDESHPENR